MARVKGWFSRKKDGKVQHIPISERQYSEEITIQHEVLKGATGWGKAGIATFPNKCLSCGEPIHRGDRIYFRRGEGAIHANCKPPAISSKPLDAMKVDWKELARRLTDEYSKQLGIDKPEVEFFEGKPRHLGRTSPLVGKVIAYNPDGSVKSETEIPRSIVLTERFAKYFEKDPEKAERALKFTIAHELGHRKNPLFLLGPSKKAEDSANEEAEKLTGISRDQHTREIFELEPVKKRGDTPYEI